MAAARTMVNGAMARGEHREVASALCRMPGAVSGLRDDLRDKIIEHSISPENEGRFNDLAEELGAIEQAEEAFQIAQNEIIGGTDLDY